MSYTKTNTLLILSFLFSFSLFAQENNIKNNNELEDEIPITSTDNKAPEGEVAFAIIENPPVHSECDENLSSNASKQCFQKNIVQLISKEFNTKLAGKLGLPNGAVKISVFFKINKEGYVSDIKARAPHPKLENEAIRIIKLIPKFKRPGIQRGKPVVVPYHLPIKFTIENSAPLTKKELKAIKRAEKKLKKATNKKK